MLRAKVPYQELGAQYVDDRNKTPLLRHPQRRLESLGYKVELHPLPRPQEMPC
jgi:hypothetical protein